VAIVFSSKVKSRFFNIRHSRALRENITAYSFLFPAGLVLFIFHIFPIVFAFYVSLHEWRRFPGEYRGLENYTHQLGDLTYVLFIWIAIGLILHAGAVAHRLWQESQTEKQLRLYFIPAFINTIAIGLFTHWFFTLLRIILEIPQRIQAQGIERIQGVFVQELVRSFTAPEARAISDVALLMAILALIVGLLFLRFQSHSRSFYWWSTTTISLFFFAAGLALLQLILGEIGTSIETARVAGTELPLWSQITLISLGAALCLVAFGIWRRAHTYDQGRFPLALLAAFTLLLAGYLLIAELPQALTNANPQFLNALNITVMLTFGSVPIQLALGLGLACLMFQNIKGKAFYRILYFLPYITPLAATSLVFRVLFSNQPLSPINRFLQLLGIEPQNWLLESRGVFQLMFGAGVPDFLAGPGLALVVMMIFAIWMYAGFDAVVFLAGLGNISGDLYEAARIDGASGWSVFRHITFPLLAPTTFFLTLIAIIGSFKSFTAIWIMRHPAAFRAVDTIGVEIFETVTVRNQMGRASAMALVLFGVILLLTLFQNRILGSRVFYG
jgi:ABC-type sugar transport system permease subunit